MAKTYRRADGFEVQDVQDRSVELVAAKYGGEFVEVVAAQKPSELELASIASVKRSKRDAVLAKLKITKEDLTDLLNG